MKFSIINPRPLIFNIMLSTFFVLVLQPKEIVTGVLVWFLFFSVFNLVDTFKKTCFPNYYSLLTTEEREFVSDKSHFNILCSIYGIEIAKKIFKAYDKNEE